VKAFDEQEHVQEEYRDADIEFSPPESGDGIFIENIVHQCKPNGQPYTIQQCGEKSPMAHVYFLDGAHANDAQTYPAVQFKPLYVEK
jgi:hypothetical protein